MSGVFASTALLWGVVATVLAFHVCVCLYVLANPQDVASVIAQPNRTILAWIFLSALRVGGSDPEMDLVQNSVPHDAVVANCRRRAAVSLFTSGFGIVALLYYFAFRGMGFGR